MMHFDLYQQLYGTQTCVLCVKMIYTFIGSQSHKAPVGGVGKVNSSLGCAYNQSRRIAGGYKDNFYPILQRCIRNIVESNPRWIDEFLNAKWVQQGPRKVYLKKATSERRSFWSIFHYHSWYYFAQCFRLIPFFHDNILATIHEITLIYAKGI